MIEKDTYCDDMLNRTSAIQAALTSIQFFYSFKEDHKIIGKYRKDGSHENGIVN